MMDNTIAQDIITLLNQTAENEMITINTGGINEFEFLKEKVTIELSPSGKILKIKFIHKKRKFLFIVNKIKYIIIDGIKFEPKCPLDRNKEPVIMEEC